VSEGSGAHRAGPAPGRRADIVLVVAAAENGVIGRDGGMPWRLKSELRHFRRLTWGKPVVMGRKTYLSIPPRNRPLEGRTNIVVSRDPTFSARGVAVAADLGTALAVARGDALRRGAHAIMVAGGAEVFAQAMAIADEIALTLVHCNFQGDTVFPPIDADIWQEIERTERPAGPDDEAAFALLRYRRGGGPT